MVIHKAIKSCDNGDFRILVTKIMTAWVDIIETTSCKYIIKYHDFLTLSRRGILMLSELQTHNHPTTDLTQ